MSYDSLTVVASRFYDIAVFTAEIFGWAALIAGGVGLIATNRSPSKHRRAYGLFLGGIVALGSVLLIDNIYSLITYVMVGETSGIDHARAMYPQLFLDAFPEKAMNIVSLAGTFSQIAATIGMAGAVFGAGLHGLAKKRSIYNRKSQRVFYGGVALMIMSVSERLLAATAYILLQFLVGSDIPFT